jgi:hypothetical protein
MSRRTLCQTFAWSLSAVVAVLAVLVWGQDFNWAFDEPYQLFPLLGLMAFSLMWSHYISGAARDLLSVNKDTLVSYYRITGWAVLVLICLHPGILIYQRYQDGFGLPPGSYTSYVGSSMAWLTILGTASLLAFLAYELHRWYRDRSWWQYVVLAGDLAMLAIFYHGLRLGSQLQAGSWYLPVWWFFGITLTAALIRSYYVRWFNKEKPA